MKKLFVSYELAKLAREKGFNECCFAFYQIEQYEDAPVMVDDDIEYRNSGFRTCKNNEIPEHYVSAPLYQQLVDWFREKHNLLILVSNVNKPEIGMYGYDIHRLPSGVITMWNKEQSVKTYYEALNKSIEESFKLI